MRLVKFVHRNGETESLALFAPAFNGGEHVVSLQYGLPNDGTSYEVCLVNGTIVGEDDESDLDAVRASTAFQIATGLWPYEFEADPRCRVLSVNGPR